MAVYWNQKVDVIPVLQCVCSSRVDEGPPDDWQDDWGGKEPTVFRHSLCTGPCLLYIKRRLDKPGWCQAEETGVPLFLLFCFLLPFCKQSLGTYFFYQPEFSEVFFLNPIRHD